MGASRKQGQLSGSQAPQPPTGSVFDPQAPELPGQAHELEGMLERGAAEDPLFRFLQKRWQSLLLLALAVVVVVYGRNAMLSGREADLKRAADTFAAVRQQLASRETLIGRTEELLAKEEKKEKKSEEEEKQLASLLQERTSIDERIKSSLAALKTEREPYQSLAQVYEAQVLPNKNQAEHLSAALQAFESARTQNKDEARFFAELSTLRLARLALDEGKTFAAGVAALRRLLDEGQFVQVAAAQSLARSMNMPAAKNAPMSDEERESLRAALEQASRNQPALAEQFERILERL